MCVRRGRAPASSSILAFTAMLWTSLVFAQQRVPLTIAEAERLATDAEPGRVALLARAEAMREQAVVAGHLPDPSLRVGLANYPLDGGGFSAEGMTQAQLGLRQAFPRALGDRADVKRATGEAFAFSADARRREVLTAVRQAWLDVYMSDRAWDLVNSSRPLFVDLVTITTSLYSVGRKSQHDVLRAELELSRLDDRLIEVGRARAEAQAALSQWVGKDAYRPIAATLPNWEVLPLLEDLRASLDTHPQLAAAEAGIDAAKAGVRVARANKKPGWSLDFGYGYREGFLPDGRPRSDFVSLSVAVELPLFAKNRQHRELSAALSERRAATQSRTAMQLRLDSRLGAEYASWTDLTRRLALYETRILEQSQSRAQAALLAYQSDTGDFADVMRAWIDDLDTRLEHIRLQVARAQSYAALADLGGLNP